MAGKRIHLLAVHENLHSRDGRQVDRQCVDDRVDSEQLVERAAAVVRARFARQIDERVARQSFPESFEDVFEV